MAFDSDGNPYFDGDEKSEYLSQVRQFGVTLTNDEFEKWRQEMTSGIEYDCQPYDPGDPRRSAVIASQLALKRVRERKAADQPAEQFKTYLQKSTGKSKAEIERWAKEAEDDDQIIYTRGR
jgi:hypothetical protein